VCLCAAECIRTDSTHCTQQVRAYDKKPLLPDALLGEATVELSSLSLGDSHVAGSGGGANVQVGSANLFAPAV